MRFPDYFFSNPIFLKGQEVLAVEPQLFEVWNASILQHWWWAAHKNLGISAESGKMILHHFLVDKTGAVLPRSGRSVQGVPELKPVRAVRCILATITKVSTPLYISRNNDSKNINQGRSVVQTTSNLDETKTGGGERRAEKRSGRYSKRAVLMFITFQAHHSPFLLTHFGKEYRFQSDLHTALRS